MRIKLTVAYNGTNFAGLQIQKQTKNTVIGIMQEALKRLGLSTKLHPSGRTDKGVHATGQVLHCDLPRDVDDLQRLRKNLNRHLPDSIHIRKIENVGTDFHARYSAKRRVYRYVMREGESNPFEADFITFVDKLDFSLLAETVRLFEGEHDFSFFKKNGSVTSHSVRTVFKARAYRFRGTVILYFEANGYLRAQIRMMVGILLKINSGKHTPEELKEQLACIERHCIKPAPHNGLYLAKIHY